MTVGLADPFSFPYAVNREYRDYSVWIVIVVTDLAVEGFKLFDLFDIF